MVEQIPKTLRIGGLSISPPLVMAPMAGITNTPFRLACRKGGAGLAFTEMISARALRYGSVRTREMGVLDPGDRPLAAQIFGREPGEMALAARYLEEEGADIVDINMGCPVKKILKSGSGVQLMREPDRAAAVVREVVRAVTVPVTVKIRLGWSDAEENYLDLGPRLAGEGASALTLHPRTRVQGYTGRARWAAIAALKEAVDVPVVGNGDVIEPADAGRLFAATGCDAVMVGRGALGRPWLFTEMARDLGEDLPAVTTERCRDLIAGHVAAILRTLPGRAGVGHLRKHLAWYSKGIPGGSAFRREINREPDPDRIVGMAAQFLSLAGLG